MLEYQHTIVFFILYGGSCLGKKHRVTTTKFLTIVLENFLESFVLCNLKQHAASHFKSVCRFESFRVRLRGLYA